MELLLSYSCSLLSKADAMCATVFNDSTNVTDQPFYVIVVRQTHIVNATGGSVACRGFHSVFAS